MSCWAGREVKSENRNPKSETNPKSEEKIPNKAQFQVPVFFLWISDLFRISIFGFRIYGLAVATHG
jgi:hypothetical protein